jgi:hypothetical protein
VLGFSRNGLCQGQPYQAGAPTPQITATGKATLDATADTAHVRFVVEYETNDVAVDQIAVNTLIRRAFAALEYVGVNRDEIQASGIDIAPIYAPARGNGAALNTAEFRATAMIDVDLQAEQLNHVGNVVEAVLKAGGTRLDGTTFGVSPGSPQRAAVIAQATQDAQAKAQAMATALGVELTTMDGAGDSGITVTPAKTALNSSANNPLRLEASVTVYYLVTPIVASNNELPY